jgi:hypothetical protein
MATGAIFPATGQREDLSDIITVVDAKNTPFLSAAKKGADITNAGIYSFQADRYNDPSFDGELSNADVTTFDDPTKFRALLSARGMKVRRAVKVDDFVQNASNPAGVGRKKEMARAISRSLVEISRDLESAFCSDRDSQEQSGTSPFRSRGLFRWVDSAAQNDLPVPANYRTPDASINTAAVGSVTESNVQALLQSIYEQTGQIDSMVLLCGPSLKRQFTEFTRFSTGTAGAALSIRSFNQNSEAKKITSSISVYEGDFGTLRIVPSLYLRKNNNATAQAGSGLVLDMDKHEVRFARRPRFQELEDQGGGPRGLIDAIASVTCMAPQSQGKFTAGVALAA